MFGQDEVMGWYAPPHLDTLMGPWLEGQGYHPLMSGGARDTADSRGNIPDDALEFDHPVPDGDNVEINDFDGFLHYLSTAIP